MGLRTVGVLLLALWVGACSRGPETHRISGETMGTYFNVAVVVPPGTSAPRDLRALVDQALAPVNARLSNWDEASEVSRFNALRHTDAVPVSAEFADVMAVAMEVHERSHGQFDVTLAPLIELWGFGAPAPSNQVPSDAQVEEALSAVGQGRWLELRRAPAAPTLRKANPETSVYLAALAKGYGIDAIAKALHEAGWRDFMVEIGGDLYAAGSNETGGPWRIGVERPDALRRTVHQILDASDLAMATSGDYRNYFEVDGVRYSHIIDAVTGRPVTHTTASVTVLAPTAIRADAWATALLALGAERGMEVAQREGLAALFIARDAGSSAPAFVSTASDRFTQLQATSARP